MQAALGYLRVSTREQGRSGLGLAACFRGSGYEVEPAGLSCVPRNSACATMAAPSLLR